MVSDIKGLINRETSATRQGQGSARVDARRDSESAGVSSTATDDTVELSSVVEVLRSAARELAAQPAVDEARVKDIRDALARGEYTVDPERLARKLIDADNA